MKWKAERDHVLARLDDLESKVTALEAADPGEPPIEPPDDRDADLESAWSSVMNGQAGIQIAVVNPGDPRFNGGPFVVEDNKDGKVGEGDSVVAAFEAYKARGGKRHGTSAALSDFEYAQAEFFCTPGNVRAPTSTRRSNQGFHCDYFRSGVTPQGGDKVGPFDSAGKAVEALRAKLGGDV